MNFGFIIDNRKCIGCHACTVACKAEHNVPVGVNRTWVKYVEKGQYPHTRRLFSVMRCNHCEDAPCVEICPVQALFIREDGIVDFDKRRCIGCKACTQACPYDALYIDPETHTAAKCNYCAHRIDIGLEPACVNVCPEHAIISGDLDDPNSEISRLMAREQVSARKVEKGTRPKLFYIDGDEASLTPVATSPATEYMWSSQGAGVGHYARYAERLLAQADPVALAKKLSDAEESALREEIARAGVIIPEEGDQAGLLQKAIQVVRENARRVYDAPSKGVMWGWQVSAYVWTKALAAGAFLIPFFYQQFHLMPISQATVLTGLLTGLVFLAITGVLLIIDLDRPARFAYVLLRPQWRSWLVKGGYSITLFGALLTLGLLNALIRGGLGNTLGWLTALLAVITAAYTAFLFAQARGRDFWQSPVLPVHMLVHALMAGAAFFALMGLLRPENAAWNAYLRLALGLLLLVNLIVLAIELGVPHPTLDAKKTVRSIVTGRFAVAFWLGSLVAGHLVPLVLVWLGGSIPMAVAGALVLLGMYATEHIWVRAPQLIPLS
ncbi:MAG: 4Fe-4S ferredoxin [Calditrichaeota bacterium]|nr:MAG: 4Fe-4S ferredoxin [Calditrichota bacterium]